MKKLKDIDGNEFQFQPFSEDSELFIKVGLFDSKNKGISEGIWAVCSPEDYARYMDKEDSGSGKFVVAMANDPIQIKGGYGLHLIAEWQGTDRPIVDLAKIDLEGSDEVFFE